MSGLSRRMDALEALSPASATHGRMFLWGYGQKLDDALADAGLSLDDGPVFPIKLLPPLGDGVEECPLHALDVHRLGS